MLPAGFIWLNTAIDIKSLPSAVPEAKHCKNQIADGHRMTPRMDEALKLEGVWKADRVYQAGGSKVCVSVKTLTHFIKPEQESYLWLFLWFPLHSKIEQLFSAVECKSMQIIRYVENDA